MAEYTFKHIHSVIISVPRNLFEKIVSYLFSIVIIHIVLIEHFNSFIRPMKLNQNYSKNYNMSEIIILYI